MIDDGARVFGFAASALASMATVGKPDERMTTSVSIVSSALRSLLPVTSAVTCESAL